MLLSHQGHRPEWHHLPSTAVKRRGLRCCGGRAAFPPGGTVTRVEFCRGKPPRQHTASR